MAIDVYANNCLLIIAQAHSYRIAPYLKAAYQRGLKPILASNGEYSLIQEVSDGLCIDFNQPEEALEQILQLTQNDVIVGVVGCDDSTVELAAEVAQSLGLPHNPPLAAKLSRRKDLARAHLLQAGCSVPKHLLINIAEFLQQPLSSKYNISFPCVIKPINLSASRGVIRANNNEELIVACQRIQGILADLDVNAELNSTDVAFEQAHALIEDYIDGVEVAFEGYLQNGQLYCIALFDKPDPLEGPFFEETIYVTPSNLSDTLQAMILKRLAQACDAYGLRVGPIHAELRVDGKDAWILEIASRTMGGDCARMLDSNSLDGDNEFTLEALSITLLVGQKVQVSKPQGSRGVMMIPIPKEGILRKISGLDSARKVNFVEKVDIIIAKGHKLIPLPEGDQYLGYIFARADTPAEVTKAIRDAHAKIQFAISPLWEIAPAC
ncbi:ATP-grasp domain-containing protein [sulfur-oxidizing endosymbiont of Gigantopelta aegis]|uniref:ATP-grasp domain-containing protein n=1 Tax=sulfur-oxidizing endosymbiont of Gigantopelta aegis TaxID=2794934 RepID=UPI0018DB15A9|nr:ATP-grasp domain-containing protein [sulfur-oxidizing endosymbiont of Gigantopelta aegis]